MKTLRNSFSVLLFMLVSFSLRAGDFVRTKEGIIVRPDAPFGGNAKEVELKVIADNIIRIIAVADENVQPLKSMIISGGGKEAKWDVTSSEHSVSLKTAKITAVVDLHTGAVSFFDAAGKQIVSEKVLGRSLRKQVFEGEQLYSIQQDFITAPDDSWYGLGQHQDGLMNYKGYQVQLFQNNTEVAVPFLVSKKNYGILWDNYSLTKFGDVRDYQQLNALKLFSKQGEQGWITASYYNNKNDQSKPAVEKPESSISYEFLNDSKLFFPKEFIPANGLVTWEGSIASDMNGIHKFRFTYSGYVKLWVDSKLVLDRWRQNWNPGSAILDIDLQKGKKYSFKMEWVPTAAESYLSCKWLPPLTPEEENSYSFSSEAGHQLDYYFIYGESMDAVIAGYRHLTGKAVMMPKWSLGFWQSRERYKTQGELLSTVAEFRKRKIPIDNIVQDWFYWKENEWGSQEFDPSRFPSPESMIKTLHEQLHTRLMISVWPKFYEGVSTYKQFEKNGWLYKRNVADSVRDWVGPGYRSTFYDVFNPGARKAFWDLINNKIYTKNIDAWWMDASEPDVLSNVSPQRRKDQMSPTAAGPAALVLNAYPLQNAKGIYEGQRSTDPNKRVFLLTRSGFAGSQRYAAAIWSGDIAARWHDMHAQIAAGANFSMSGIPYWTMDIGGFSVEPRYEKPNEQDLDEWREQMTRWYQFGAFVPLFRAHGQFPYREIFHVAPENHPAYQSILYYNKLRYRLLPYVYSLAGHAYHNDATMMRGLVMDFPGDTIASNLNDAYLFGPSLLINPVFNYKQRTREVYLPKNAGWYNLYSGQYAEGGHRIMAEASYERMPVFVKAGSIIPFGPDLQYTSEKPADPITLYVYTGTDGTFSIYEDDGTNYDYEKGAFSIIPLTYSEATRTLTIGERKGSFNSMLQQRKFHIVWITKENKKGIDTQPKTDQTIMYTGKPVTVRRK